MDPKVKFVYVPGLVTDYVVTNSIGQYLQDIDDSDLDNQVPIWTDDFDMSWKYGSEVAWHDAKQFHGTVYAVVKEV